VIDYHVHLWRHEPHLSLQATVEQLAGYCARAAELGVRELAVTEHTSRFAQFDALVRGWWDSDPDPALRAEAAEIWDAEQGADLDQYVETALAARAAGLPVVIGLEVDYIPGRMADVAALLGGYPFDVLLGSVHWVGAWFFDVMNMAAAQQEWANRSVERAWDDYTRALEELAGTGAVDVLAHPDVVKVTGQRRAPAGSPPNSTPRAGASRVPRPTPRRRSWTASASSGSRSRPPRTGTSLTSFPGGSVT
jgi:histidinol-phosphatase (PHP family)